MRADNKRSVYAVLMLLVVVAGFVVAWVSWKREQDVSGVFIGVLIAAVSIILRVLSVKMKKEKAEKL
jgi:hypothetical protein